MKDFPHAFEHTLNIDITIFNVHVCTLFSEDLSDWYNVYKVT